MDPTSMTALASRLLTSNGHAATVTQSVSATQTGSTESFAFPGADVVTSVMVQENGTVRRFSPQTLETSENRKLLVDATLLTTPLAINDVLTLSGVPWIIRRVTPTYLRGVVVLYEVEIDL